MRATTVIKFYTHEDRQSDLHGEGGVQRSQHEQRERGYVRSESSWQPRYAPRILLSTQRNMRTPVPYCARALEFPIKAFSCRVLSFCRYDVVLLQWLHDMSAASSESHLMPFARHPLHYMRNGRPQDLHPHVLLPRRSCAAWPIRPRGIQELSGKGVMVWDSIIGGNGAIGWAAGFGFAEF